MKKNSIKLLSKLIKIESLSQNHLLCFKALELIKDDFENNHIPCFIGSNNGFPFLIAGDKKTAKTLLLSHIDIVPGESSQFKVKIEDTIIFGRGVLDMKGPLIAALDAFIRIWEVGNRSFMFCVTSDEEIGGFNGSRILTKTLFKNIKAAIIPDSSGDDMVSIQKAPFHIRVICSGKSCHGSRPWEGVNAAEILMDCVKIENIDKKSPDQTSACISQIYAGKATNTVPNKAEAVIDIRIKADSELEDLLKHITMIVKKWKCSWEKIDKPLFFGIPNNNLFINQWKKTFENISGKKLNTKIDCGASDARFLWHDLQIPIVITSAIGGGAHSESEWVDLGSLKMLSEIIFKFGLSITNITL